MSKKESKPSPPKLTILRGVTNRGANVNLPPRNTKPPPPPPPPPKKK